MGTIEVVGLGALNMDNIYRVERILDDGEAVVAGPVSSPGGSAANTIYGLARLGVRTGFAGVVGKDNEGKMLLRDFAQAGVDTSQVRLKGQARTGSVLCLSDSLGRRSLYVSPGANSLLTREDINLDYINQAEMLHVSSFADDRQFTVLLELIGRLAPSVRLSFAPGSLYAPRGLSALAPILAKTYALFINQSEIQRLTGQEDVPAATESCLRHGCQIVVVTLGQGAGWKNTRATAYVRDLTHQYVIEPVRAGPISVSDTTGAGDAFAAGFLYGLLKGKGLDECGRLGDIVARFSITKIGARQGLPTIDELSLCYRDLYNREL